MISDIISVESEDTFKRPIYAGNAIATVRSNDVIKVMSVRSTGFDAVSSEGGEASIEKLDIVKDHKTSVFEKEDLAKSD